jgi:hypothetical protein
MDGYACIRPTSYFSQSSVFVTDPILLASNSVYMTPLLTPSDERPGPCHDDHLLVGAEVSVDAEVAAALAPGHARHNLLRTVVVVGVVIAF